MKTLFIILTVSLVINLTTVPAIAQGSACADDYTVQADDWLSKLADRYFGDMFAYSGIVDATNSAAQTDSSYATIADPDVIEVGQKLCIPAADRAQQITAKFQNAMSAGPAVIAQEAAILEYPEGWPGNWPNEPGEELVELRPGSNGWTCIADIPDTPGNDPMCLNETYLGHLKARYAKIDPPSTGIGIGYMLQGGGPVGSPPHMMIFTPGSREGLTAFDTDPGPIPWVMFPETPYEHLMVTVSPPSEAVSVEEDKIANATSAGPTVIAEEATILEYPEGWPGNWPDEPGEELVELRPGSNGWTCIADIPDTPGNDPMCLNETYLGHLKARYAKIDPPSTGIGIGYMLQGGGPVGSPPHMMIFTPGSREGLTAFDTDPGPIPWVMFPETSYEHLMVSILYGDN